MTRFLAHTTKLQGLSKNKVIAVGAVIGILVLLAILFGVFAESNKMDMLSKSENNTYNTQNTASSINQVLDQVNQNTAKDIASNANALNLMLNDQRLKSVIASTPVATLVPPIINANGSNEMQIQQAKQRFELKQVDNRYISFMAKSLIYSNLPSKVNTSNSRINDSLANNASVPGSTTSALSSVANVLDQNQQDEKHKFMTTVADNDYLNSSLQAAKSPYEIKAGSIIPATMINGLNSDLPGQIIAQVRENVYDSSTRRFLLIPQGARLVGLYDSNISYGQERVLVAWNRLIYQDGSSINLKTMPGTNLEGYAGFDAEVNNHYWKIFGSSFIMGVITAGMQYSQNNTNANVQSGGIGLKSNYWPDTIW